MANVSGQWYSKLLSEYCFDTTSWNRWCSIQICLSKRTYIFQFIYSSSNTILSDMFLQIFVTSLANRVKEKVRLFSDYNLSKTVWHLVTMLCALRNSFNHCRFVLDHNTIDIADLARQIMNISFTEYIFLITSIAYCHITYPHVCQ